MPSKAAKTSTSGTSEKTPTKDKSRARKPSAKKPSVKKVSIAKTKATANKAVSAKRSTVSSLAQDLKSLETRLKGADTKNRNALKSLQKVVSEAKSAARTSNITQKAALTRGLNALESRMESYLDRATDQARSGVRAELAAVTASGAGIATLEQAVQGAHSHLDTVETAQRESIARMNRYIADLASAVDSRLAEETKAREAVEAALNTKITRVDKRVDQVEQDTAVALETIGDKVAEFAAVLDDRAKQSDTDTAERLVDLAQETQSEFNHVQTDMTARLEALETIAANWSPTETVYPANMEDPRVDNMAETLSALQGELARMHARMAAVQTQASTPSTTLTTPLAAPAPLATPTPITPPTNVVPMPLPQSGAPLTAMDNPYAEASRALEANSEKTVAPQETQREKRKKVAQKDSHIPQEYDPNAFQSKTEPYQGLQGTNPAISAPLITPEEFPTSPAQSQTSSTPLAPPMASQGGHMAPAPSHAHMLGGIEPVMPAPLTAPSPVSTYADPAYAEEDQMRAERIGGETLQRPGLPKLPITGRNLRVGALAAGVAVVGLFAAKTVLGGGENPNTTARNDAAPQTISAPNNSAQGGNFSLPGLAPAGTIAPSAPQGTYAETQPPVIAPDKQDTLEKAVQADNPIAQFQLGLAKLQAGEAEEAARLIRLSANRNQPAAQYRLAKLYETGTGVTKDLVTARELVQRAAQGGNRIAMHDLGNYHAYGHGGLEQDMGQALDWFTKAAERGVVDSQFNVAFLSEGNQGVPVDLDTALFWYHVAARQGDQGAPERISVINGKLGQAARNNIKTRAGRFNPKPVDEAANGIFRDVPWAKPAQTAQAQAQLQVVNQAEIIKIRDAQTLLTELGYQIGGADGAAGPKTRAAIREFEKVNGLPETGEITDDLIDRLEIAAGA